MPLGPQSSSGSAFTDVLKLLSKVFDVVIIDAPPILKASEATTIVRYADAAIVVVRHGVTTERQLGLAIAELQRNRARRDHQPIVDKGAQAPPTIHPAHLSSRGAT